MTASNRCIRFTPPLVRSSPVAAFLYQQAADVRDALIARAIVAMLSAATSHPPTIWNSLGCSCGTR